MKIKNAKGKRKCVINKIKSEDQKNCLETCRFEKI